MAWRASASWLRRNSSWPRPLHRSLHWALHSLPGAEDPRRGRLALSWGDAINASGAAMNDAGGSAPRFGVLGPLRVWRGESVVDLGPLQQRVVLAVLLLQGGRPIARQQMISAVWGEEPPAHAVNLVQRHVSGLRRVLGHGGPGGTASFRLVWTDAGYLLTLPGGALDLEVFEGELRRARAARA